MRVLTGLTWRPTDHDERVLELLRGWQGTPYMEGSQVQGVGVDCFRFVCAVLDALEGSRTHVGHIPADQSLHDRRGAYTAFREVLKRYEPFEVVKDKVIEAGDVFITGPKHGGPGHAMIAGPNRGTIWHCPGPNQKVCMTGQAHPGRLFRIYRVKDKDQRWL